MTRGDRPSEAGLADYQAIVAAPGFSLGVHCSDEEVLAIRYCPPQPERAPTNLLAAEVVRQLRAYLVEPGFVFGLPLRPSGTAFQRRVWTEIALIPNRQTRSYGDLARTLRSAPRAVGQACGANPFALAIPCHRVIAAGGRLGGFAHRDDGFMLGVKRWLLEHEAA